MISTTIPSPAPGCCMRHHLYGPLGLVLRGPDGGAGGDAHLDLVGELVLVDAIGVHVVNQGHLQIHASSCQGSYLYDPPE